MPAASGWTTAQAAHVPYEGTLASGAQATGTVDGFSWFLDQDANVDYGRFQGNAASTATLFGRRLDGNLDPVLGLYFGTTTADTSQFVSEIDWGGLLFPGSLDDERPASILPGPNGDPSAASRCRTRASIRSSSAAAPAPTAAPTRTRWPSRSSRSLPCSDASLRDWSASASSVATVRRDERELGPAHATYCAGPRSVDSSRRRIARSPAGEPVAVPLAHRWCPWGPTVAA
ncbi:MAG: hypothetical protein ABI277_13435 [Burkholderiaceae bacterium]